MATFFSYNLSESDYVNETKYSLCSCVQLVEFALITHF